MSAELVTIEVQVCHLCLSGVGGECHVPGCLFWMSDAPVTLEGGVWQAIVSLAPSPKASTPGGSL